MKSARFSSIEALPPHLREQARKRLDGVRAPLGDKSGDNARVIHGVDYGSSDGETVVHGLHRDGVTTITSVRTHKYGAKAVVVNGIRFDSKREARHYERLCLRVAAGEVRYFLRQVPLHLPGGTKLVVDFQEFHADGSVHYVDAKGFETAAFKIKRREVEACYPIRLELV